MPDDEQKQEGTPEETTAAPAEKPEAEQEAAPAHDIASRVDAALGSEESDVDRVAREEEEKLQARKKQAKKGKKGLEAAASKRLARIGEVQVKRPTSALRGEVSPEAMGLYDRGASLGNWIKEHGPLVGGLVTVAVLGLVGLVGYTYWQGKQNAEASAILAQGFTDQRGLVSDKEAEEEDDKPRPMYPTFKTAAERRDAALAKYRAVESQFAGSGAAYLAKLAEGGELLDAGDAKGAIAAYQDVKGSPLAQADGEVRGRAIEGIGFANELLARTDTAGKDAHLDAALDAFKQLEQVDMKGFKELGKYHQARVLEEKGDRVKAVELLKDVMKSVQAQPGEHPFAYLETVADDRLRELDPTALPPKAPKGMDNIDMSNPQIQELIRKLQQQQQGGGPLPGAPQ